VTLTFSSEQRTCRYIYHKASQKQTIKKPGAGSFPSENVRTARFPRCIITP